MAIVIERKSTGFVCNETLHYYGTSFNPNDVDEIPQGTVWYLRDNPKDTTSPTYHPYVVIYDAAMDKIGKKMVFPITSTPTIENMTPIVMKNSIGYINWHHPVSYKITEFKEPGTKFLGFIAEKEAFKVSLLMYSTIYLKINDLYNIPKSVNINRFLDYIDAFEKRSKNIEPYEHKVLPTNEYSRKLKLIITFKRDEEDTEEVDDIGANISLPEEPTEEVSDDMTETVVETDVEEEPVEVVPEVSKIETVKTTEEKSTIIVDLKSHALVAATAAIEGKEIKLPRMNKNLSVDEIKLFLAYIKLNTREKAARIYGMSLSGIDHKQHAIEDMYNIVYNT